jgi:light-regulated signal transduction histidine kinase (bacteriophytochrome)
MGDRVQLRQVLMNLMMNSIDAMRDVNATRELTINSQRGENEQLVVSVSDRGEGLPLPQADQIFQCLLYHQTSWHRHGTSHQPIHCGIMAAACGLPQLFARCKLSPHPSRQNRGS